MPGWMLVGAGNLTKIFCREKKKKQSNLSKVDMSFAKWKKVLEMSLRSDFIRKAGCVIVEKNAIVARGYNRKLVNCTIHAEMQALLNLANSYGSKISALFKRELKRTPVPPVTNAEYIPEHVAANQVNVATNSSFSTPTKGTSTSCAL